MSAAAPRRILPGQHGGALAWIVTILLLLGLLAGGALLGYWAFMHLVFGFTLTDQPGTILLPRTLDIIAKVNKPLDIGMNGLISANVPINNDVAIPFKGDYDLDVTLKAEVPVEFEIVYQGFLPIDSVASIVATTDFNFQSVKNLRNLSFAAKLPMKMRLPVTLRVQVKQTIALDYHGPLRVHADQELHSHLTSAVPAKLRVNQTITTPVLGSIQLHADLPQDALKVVINHADLRMRLDSLRLLQAPDPGVPWRVDSPWGPGVPDLRPQQP